MYDVTNRESFGKIENWLNELETYSTNHDIVKMLVGNKVRIYKKSKLRAKPKCAIFFLFSRRTWRRTGRCQRTRA